jgi:hypothetical protein
MVGANGCAALKHGRSLLHPFFPCYVVSKKFRSRDLEDFCVQMESCLHILRPLLYRGLFSRIALQDY